MAYVGVALKDLSVGEIVNIGKRDYVILNNEKGITSLISCKPVVQMKYGDTVNGSSWFESNVRLYLNNEFYNDLIKEVDSNCIIRNSIDLTANDGTGKGIICKDYISILSCDMYRQYREILNDTVLGGISWSKMWTLTKTTYNKFLESNYNELSVIETTGMITTSDYSDLGDVYPYFCLDSNKKVYCKRW